MQIGPRDVIALHPRRQWTEAKAPQHPAEADLDADDLHDTAGTVGEHHICDPGQPLAGNIDDLCIKNVTPQQNLVGRERIDDARDGEIDSVAAQLDTVVIDRHDGLPRHKQVMLAVQQDSLDTGGIRVQARGDIGDTADRATVRPAHVAADDPAQQQHLSSMP